MPDSERKKVNKRYQEDLGVLREILPGCAKADVKAAVDAVDDWVVANAASYNSALPTAFKNNATAAQKARLLTYVVERRYETGA